MSDSSEEDNLPIGRDLSPEEMDKLVQFQSLTGIEEIEICRAMLESKDWDLEATVREQMNIPNDRETAAADREIPDIVEAPGARLPPPQNNVVANRHNYGLISWGIYLLTLPVAWPMRLAYHALNGILGFVSSLFGLAPTPRRGNGGSRSRSGHLDPIQDVRRFKAEFETQYGVRHPPFHQGSYSQVLEEAKRDLKFLLVYLHCPEHQDSDRFCETTLADPSLEEFLTERNILFWGCSVESGEGYRVSQAMRESTYPFLAVIVLRQNRMMIVGRLEGFIAPGPLLVRLEEIIHDNEAFIVAARADRQERNFNQELREEQDAAFQESLRQDQEKERKKQEEDERKRKEEEEEQRRIKEEQDRVEKIRQMKIDLVNEVPAEPESSNPDCIRILVKLPDGQRLERRFLRTQSLKVLYYYVFCHPDSPDEFEITTNFPRKVIACVPQEGSPDPVSFVEAGLGKSEMLFVTDLQA